MKKGLKVFKFRFLSIKLSSLTVNRKVFIDWPADTLFIVEIFSPVAINYERRLKLKKKDEKQFGSWQMIDNLASRLMMIEFESHLQ